MNFDPTPNAPAEPTPTLGHDGSVPPELSHAGTVVDRAIEYMIGKDLPPLAIASALLGGSLGVLARTMDQATMLRMLANAADSVRAGELHPQDGRVPPLD